MKTVFEQYADKRRKDDGEPLTIRGSELASCAVGLRLFEVEVSERDSHFELSGGWVRAGATLDDLATVSEAELLAAFEKRLIHNIGLDGVLSLWAIVGADGRFKVKFRQQGFGSDEEFSLQYEDDAAQRTVPQWFLHSDADSGITRELSATTYEEATAEALDIINYSIGKRTNNA